jgi:hypothetical protein
MTPTMETPATAPPASEAARQEGTIPARRGLMEQAREGAFHRLDQQKERAASGLSSLVGALRQSGRQLEGENATVASYVDTAAEQVERFVGGLRNRDVSEIVSDLESFARRRPTMFLGSAFMIGLVAARFLKSSTKPDEPWRQARAGASRPIRRDAEYASAGSEHPFWTESQRTAVPPSMPTTPREGEPIP